MTPSFALTFDDGPGPDTGALLDVLRDAGVKATFFLLGRNLLEAPWCGDPARARALALRAAREGHVLGNHTYSHLRPGHFGRLAPDLVRGEEAVRGVLAEAGLPADRPVPFRLPYGLQLVDEGGSRLDPRLPVVASLGLAHLHWTSDFGDWALPASGGAALGDALIAHVEAQAGLGLRAVLDLHDSGTGSSFGYARPATVEGVRRLVAHAGAHGWSPFVVPRG